VFSFGMIPLKDVWAMLDHCAPGHTRKQRTHNWLVIFGAGATPAFQLGHTASATTQRSKWVM
jgi:hypothetical protein